MSLFYDLPEASCVVSVASLAILDWNTKADALFGLSCHHPGSVPLLERVQVWNAETFVESLEAGEFDSSELRGVVGLTATGGPVQFDLLISKAHWQDQPVYLIVFSDASARVRLEEQLRQAQKMESVGMLAGGIAHDFNNLLTIISGYSHMLMASLSGDEGNRSAVEQVIKASDRAATLTSQLLSFSRRQIAQTKTLDLNSIVHGMTPMLNRLIGEHIRLRISPGSDLGSVRADQGQIEQVVMNLVVNARDAMPEGGNLWIETRNVDLDSAYVGSHIEARPGPYVMLAVTDSGTGMDRATRDKVFEPFFTTKGEGKGTGLGLSMVYGIVKRSGGSIDIYSELGQGTAIKLYLPRSNRAEASAAVESKAKPNGGTETVLVVEDDDAVRATVKSSLATLGYRILPASSGEQALEIAKGHEGVIDLIITDMVLPKMGGREVARRMHRRRPDTVVLFMSGYTDVSLTDSGDPGKQVHFIGKPFTPSGLATRVRELLDAKADARTTGRRTSG